MTNRSLPLRSLFVVATALLVGWEIGCATPSQEGEKTKPNDDDDDVIPGETQTTEDETSAETSSSDDEDSESADETVETTSTTTIDPGETEHLPDTDIKWDLHETPDLPPTENRCTKIDFVFVVDNSRSMEDEQVHLIESFPGFIEGITESAQLEDFRILVVKSDSSSTATSSCAAGVCECDSFMGGTTPSEECCVDRCLYPSNMTCAEKACTEFPEERACDDRLGTGLTTDPSGQSCNVDSGKSYILADQTDLADTFACVATVGTMGNPGELMIDATLRALAPDMLDDEGCNEGFLRDDAILVVTLITDEEEKTDPEDQGSMGDPAEWKERLMAVKDGNETAVVVAGFIGDTGEPMAICKPMQMGSIDGAQASPRLREFITSFGEEHSLLASVCAPDYAPAFQDIVDKISVACDKWIPK